MDRNNFKYPLKAYVDGAYRDGGVGYGFIIFDRSTVLAERSEPVPKGIWADSRQVGGELLATMAVLAWCEECRRLRVRYVVADQGRVHGRERAPVVGHLREHDHGGGRHENPRPGSDGVVRYGEEEGVGHGVSCAAAGQHAPTPVGGAGAPGA